MSLTNEQPVGVAESIRNFKCGPRVVKAHARGVKMNSCENFWIYVWSLGLAYEDFADGGEINHSKFYRTTYSKFYNRFHPVGLARYRKQLKHPEKWRPTPLPRLSKLRLAGLVPTPIPAPRPARTFPKPAARPAWTFYEDA